MKNKPIIIANEPWQVIWGEKKSSEILFMPMRNSRKVINKLIIRMIMSINYGRVLFFVLYLCCNFSLIYKITLDN